MASDPARRKRISEAVKWLRAQKIDLNDGTPRPVFDTQAELIAYFAERCRAEGTDEAEMAEVVLTASSTCREDLLEVDSVLRPLGYMAISSVLRRLARRAPPRPLRLSFMERLAESHPLTYEKVAARWAEPRLATN